MRSMSPRNTRIRPLLAVLASLLVAALACNFPGQAATPKAGGGAAIITEVDGPVTVREGTDGPETPAAVQQLVSPGAQVGTKDGARAKLDLPNGGAILRLDENSNLTVLELGAGGAGSQSRVGLLEGKTWIVLGDQGGEVTVETPGGMATGNGQMSVEYHSNFAGTGAPLFLVTCLTGVCSASNPFGGVALTPGQQTEVAGSNTGPSEPHPMDDQQKEDWETNVPEASRPEASTPTATLSPEPGVTITTPPPGVTPPSATPTFTATPTATATALGPPCLVVLTDANVREGPGTVYRIWGVARTDDVLEVVGRNAENTWYVVVFPLAPNGRGWIWTNLVTPCGDHSNVPVVAAPPTPTYTPTSTATFTATYTATLPRATTGTPTRTPTPTGSGTAAYVTYVQPTISADPNPVTIGCDLTNTTISWTALGASSATVNGQPVAVPEGQMAVCVLQDTTYTIIAIYPDKSQRQASVDVDLQIIAHAP